MEVKLKKIFNFLEENRKYNIEIQSDFFNSVFKNIESEHPDTEKERKIISLLYWVAETQSQGNIDKLSESYKIFHNLNDKDPKIKYTTWPEFCYTLAEAIPVSGTKAKYPKMTQKKKEKHIDDFQTKDYKPFAHLFKTIKSYPGYGDKTAALFVKMIYQIHLVDKYTNYKIWENVSPLESKDMLYLPVDAVIIEIFKKIKHPEFEKWNFNRINTELNISYDGSQIEIWDDLWFWGYITQKVVKNQDDRDFELNKNKYWVMKESDKNKKTIIEIFGEKGKAQEFIDIII